MLDSHVHPENWGIRPILFSIGDIGVTSYSVFVLLGLVAGLVCYYFLARKEKKLNDNSFYVLFSGFVGGVLGAKIPMWIINFPLIITSFPDVGPILSGRTITGGLIGGTVAVVVTKHYLGIKEKKGNLFAPGIALGVAIGRIGCFLAGCCFGIATDLPWGVDFGDGILRHPTQIYEVIFMFGMFFYLLYRWKYTKPKAGQLFFILMNSYFVFRFLEEFLREGMQYFGLTVFQYISIVALIFINTKYLIEKGLFKRIIERAKF